MRLAPSLQSTTARALLAAGPVLALAVLSAAPHPLQVGRPLDAFESTDFFLQTAAILAGKTHPQP